MSVKNVVTTNQDVLYIGPNPSQRLETFIVFANYPGMNKTSNLKGIPKYVHTNLKGLSIPQKLFHNTKPFFGQLFIEKVRNTDCIKDYYLLNAIKVAQLKAVFENHIFEIADDFSNPAWPFTEISLSCPFTMTEAYIRLYSPMHITKACGLFTNAINRGYINAIKCASKKEMEIISQLSELSCHV